VAQLAEALKKCQDEKKILRRLLRIPEKILKKIGRHMTMISD
jgi:hypothetical protein